jgi:hypothetical protein
MPSALTAMVDSELLWTRGWGNNNNTFATLNLQFMRAITTFRMLMCCAALLMLSNACSRNPLYNNDSGARLKFSTDTLLFDTVFTTVGSATRVLKVYNPTSGTLLLSEIRLAGGNASAFRLNIDGLKAPVATRVEIEPGDSLYVFAAVTVQPNNVNSPLVVADSILFTLNGQRQQVNLVAWGQDAHYIRGTSRLGSLRYKIVAGADVDTSWTAEKPIVVYGYAVVDSAGTLRIPAGARVHFFRNSGLWVYRGGRLLVEGTQAQPVTFQGTRLEADYRDLAGQWDRIWINEGAASRINWAIIRNAFIGIQAETLIGRYEPDDTFLEIYNTKILNMSGAGILTRLFTIKAVNNLIANCGGYCAALTLGGAYEFRQCTFANFWTYPIRKTPAVLLNNYNNAGSYPLSQADFYNCLVVGSNEEELLLDPAPNSAAFSYAFKNCHLRVKSDFTLTSAFTSCAKNTLLNDKDFFTDPENWKYSLKDNSPAIGFGDASHILPAFTSDLEGNPWKTPPSAGCFEK